MSKNKRKKTDTPEVKKKSAHDGPHDEKAGGATGPGGKHPEVASPYSRWAAFEEQVLARVEDPEKCMEVIARRQSQVDADSNEADLVAAYFRQQLHEARQDPQRCCVFLSTAEITKWLQEAIGSKLPINKTTPYLRALGIPQLRYTKKNGAPGWVWRGAKAPVGATAKAFRTLDCDPDD